jgi:hypothetical protein
MQIRVRTDRQKSPMRATKRLHRCTLEILFGAPAPSNRDIFMQALFSF